MLKGWLPHQSHINYGAEVLVSLYRLQAMGLVLANSRQKGVFRTSSPTLDIETVMSNLATQSPKMTFYLSGFGSNFLGFVMPNGQFRRGAAT